MNAEDLDNYGVFYLILKMQRVILPYLFVKEGGQRKEIKQTLYYHLLSSFMRYV